MAKLITGGTGYVGAELARILVNPGEEAVLFDIAVNRYRIEGIESKAKIVRGDLGNYSEVPPFPGTVKHLPSTFQPHAGFNFIWQLQKQ